MPTTALIIGSIAGIAGAGISAYSSYQQGQTANAFAQYNAHQQELNAKTSLMSMQAQAALQKRQAEAQFALRSQEAQARFNNAKTIENALEGQSKNTRENIRRRGLETDRFQASQRTMIAKSGLVESSGTPLDILADTAATIQLEREDTLYQDELNRRNLFREAELERLGGQLALAGASLDKSSAVAEAGLRSAAGRMEYRSNMREADFTRLSGAAQQKSYQGQAWGTLFSGLGQAAGSYAAIK
jgi:hypothetical protein